MKYLLVLVLALAAVMSCGCSGKTEIKENTLYLDGTIDQYKVREFEYDGCQYIAFGSGNHFAVSHKGNCKYCAQRGSK